MNEVLHANIFFFITGIAVIVFTFLLSIALFHCIKILKTVRRIVDRVEEGTATIAEDLEHLRTYVTEESILARFFRAATGRGKTKQGTRAERAPHSKAERSERKSKTELRIKNEE